MTEVRTTDAALARIPHPALRVRSRGPLGLGKVQLAETLDLLARSMSHIAGNSDAELKSDTASASQTLAAYYVKILAGGGYVGGIYGVFAEQDDVDLLAWDKSYSIDGSDAIAIAADDFDVKGYLVAVVVDGAIVLVSVWGAEAATGASVAPTLEEMGASLKAAKAVESSSIELLETAAGGLPLARFKIARAGGAVAITHEDPAAVAELAQKRAYTNIFGVAA